MFSIKQLRYFVLALSLFILVLQAVWAFAVYWMQVEYRFMQEKARIEQMITDALYLKNVMDLNEAKMVFKNDPELSRLENLDSVYRQREAALKNAKDFFLTEFLQKNTSINALQHFILPILYSVLGACFYFIQQMGETLRWQSRHPKPRFVGGWLAVAMGTGAVWGSVSAMMPGLSSAPPTFISGSFIFLTALVLGFNSKGILLVLRQHARRYLHWLWGMGHYTPRKGKYL